MTKHLADHRTAPTGGRVKAFLTIARDRSESAWRGLWLTLSRLSPALLGRFGRAMTAWAEDQRDAARVVFQPTVILKANRRGSDRFSH